MDTEPIRVLLIEDDPDDVLLLKESLAEAKAARIKLAHADRLSSGLTRLAEQGCDVILLDLNLPDSRGLDTLYAIIAEFPKIPVVVLSGLADDLTTIEAVRQGAQDYLVKGEISGPMLVRVLRYAIERKQAAEKLQESEKRFRALIENSQDIITLVGADGTLLYDSPAITRVMGYAPDERAGRKVFEFIHPDDLPAFKEHFTQFVLKTGTLMDSKARFRHKDGSWLWVEGIRNNLLAEPSVQAIIVNYRDVTTRKQAEEALRKSEENFRNIFQSVPESLLAVDKQIEILNSNKAFAELIRKYAPEMNMSEDELREKILSELRNHFGKTEHGIIEIGENPKS